MNILILANNDIGLYKFRKELIEKLIESNNRVYISLPNGELVTTLEKIGVTFIKTSIDRRGINFIKDFKLMLNYRRIIKAIKPDLIITYTIKPNIYGGLMSRLYNVPYSLNITGLGSAFQKNGFLKKIIVCLYKIASKNAENIFFENEENLNIFNKYNISTFDRMIKLNGAGVNIEEYEFTNLPDENNDIRLLFIGRIMKEKGIDELLEVARKIKNEHPEIHFDIIGPLEENYVDIIKEYNENDIINYYGYQKNVNKFIESSHCLILPSYHEGMANTLLEAGAMGRPLIASNISGCKEGILDSKSGFLINKMDAEDLYLKIVRFINLPYEKKQEMGFESRKHIERNFNRLDVVAKTIERIDLSNARRQSIDSFYKQ